MTTVMMVAVVVAVVTVAVEMSAADAPQDSRVPRSYRCWAALPRGHVLEGCPETVCGFAPETT